jgi:protein AaeX
MIKEINFAGVLFPPLLGYMAVAALLWYALKYILNHYGFYRYVWHPPLFNTALYVVLLSALVVSTL